MARRIIVILGVPRSGTSMIAGIVHKLGINTGPSIKSDNGNLNGYFEDEDFFRLHHRILRVKKGAYLWAKRMYAPTDNISEKSLKEYHDLFTERNRQKRWGLKNLTLPWVWPTFYELAKDDIAIIRTHRNISDVALRVRETWRIYLREVGMDDIKRLEQQAKRWDDWLDFLSKGLPTLDLDFYGACNNAPSIVETIASFIGVNVNEQAVSHIQQKTPKNDKS